VHMLRESRQSEEVGEGFDSAAERGEGRYYEWVVHGGGALGRATTEYDELLDIATKKGC